MYQIYVLTIVLLFLAIMLFFSDYYGWKYITLLKFKNYIDTHTVASAVLTGASALAVVLNTFFPVSPGPVLLGELFVQIALFVLFLYGMNVLFRKKEESEEPGKIHHGEEEPSRRHSSFVVERTHTLIETHKRNIGLCISLITLMHLIYPQGILI
ncbi:MAG: hypothetical protein PQJ47_07215 [Sphaerochaetaceae bacterium]|nr:hypothetical protein [Sphaerochaetaceae bacterium]